MAAANRQKATLLALPHELLLIIISSLVLPLPETSSTSAQYFKAWILRHERHTEYGDEPEDDRINVASLLEPHRESLQELTLARPNYRHEDIVVNDEPLFRGLRLHQSLAASLETLEIYSDYQRGNCFSRDNYPDWLLEIVQNRDLLPLLREVTIHVPEGRLEPSDSVPTTKALLLKTREQLATVRRAYNHACIGLTVNLNTELIGIKDATF
ncbi:MAG: hypothetical protein MMC33_009479 [Icmadophila ericetorum]|nr:hypothetical protein [Icmadophila ericetorum]